MPARRISPATRARARLSRLASFVVAYPLPGDDPALARQFDAVVRHLGESIEALGDAHGAARFSANLDELSWLDGGDPNDYIDQERDTCTRLWWQVVNCMDFRDVRGVRDALEIELPPDWRDWAWGFGFGGLLHHYFVRQEPPRGVAFAELFDAGEVHGDRLGYGTFSFRARNGLWGVRRETNDAWHVIVPPEWTNLWTSGARDDRLLWAERDGKVGLLFADGDVDRDGDGDGDEMRIVREPSFDAVWDFSGDVACVRVGERFGRAHGRHVGARTVARRFRRLHGRSRVREPGRPLGLRRHARCVGDSAAFRRCARVREQHRRGGIRGRTVGADRARRTMARAASGTRSNGRPNAAPSSRGATVTSASSMRKAASSSSRIMRKSPG